MSPERKRELFEGGKEMKNEVIFKDVRVCFLGDDILRIEQRYKGEFCDEDTFFIPDRKRFGSEGRDYTLKGNVLCFGEYSLYLPKRGTLTGLRLEKNRQEIYSYQRLKNSGELPSPHHTPEVFALSDDPRILVPREGYSANRKSEYRIQENAEDIYLLFAHKNAKKLRRLYVELTGRCELVRLSTFGGWNSKYYAYNEEEAKNLILDYERHDVPLDNMVIDTDWRSSENGWGYDINEKLFPDMKRFIEFAHSHNVEIMFNDHPEPVNGAHVFEPCEIAYREKNLQAIMELGMDTWWYDRNWHTHLISPTESVQWESFGLYLFHDITKNFYSKKAKNKDIYRRPVVMGNVVDIVNGDYLGISDSASHRYAIQWTGDIASESCTLAQEIKNLVRCSENCIPYMNSDCGGHTGNPDKEHFIRWMQYGTLSPVFRPHCTKDVLRFREPWLYDGETLDIVRDYIRLRYRLLPYIYARAYDAYRTGEAMFHSLSLEYPEDSQAERYDEYLLGKNLLIAPICGAVPQQLSEENYTAPVNVTFYDGIRWEGEPVATAVWEKVYFDLRHKPPMKGAPVYNFSAKLSTKIKVDKPKRLYVKSDDGVTVYIDGKCVLEDNATHSATLFSLIELSPNEEHSVEIKYFQAGGEAFLGLYISDVVDEGEKEVYLPAGSWMDVFDGKIYSGKQTIRKRYDLYSMPLFVRLGAILPLSEHAQNTKRQSWKKLVYDFYPDKTSSDHGFLYEDDGETTAYKTGAFSKSNYSAKYSEKENAYIVNFYAAEGSFEGDRTVAERRIKLKCHLLNDGERIACICINGKKMSFERRDRANVFPLNTADVAPDGATVTVDFVMETAKDCEVKLYLE